MKKTLLILALFLIPQFVFSAPTTTYSTTLLPLADDMYDLGSSSPQLRWRNIYTSGTISAPVSLTLSGFTQGSTLFVGPSGTIAQDNFNFFWDDTNNRLGIGTTTPWAQLSVNPNGLTGPAFAIGSSTRTDFIVTNGGNTGVGISIPTSKLHVAGGTRPDTFATVLTVTGTSGNTSGHATGVNIQYNAASNGGFGNTAFQVYLQGTNNSANRNAAIHGENQVGGSSTDIAGGSGASTAVGIYSRTQKNAGIGDTGSAIGTQGIAELGNINAGLVGTAITTKNSATNIGVFGNAVNVGSSPTVVGGFFGLMSSNPTFASAALMADNGAVAADIFVARDNGTAVVTIADGGNVGIGTTSPWGNLSISNAVTNTPRLAINNSVLLGDSYNGSGGWASSRPALVLNDGTVRANFQTVSSGSLAALGTESNHALTFITNNSEKVRIDTSGNVGIGTTSPATKLSISGDGTINGGIELNTPESATGYYLYNDGNRFVWDALGEVTSSGYRFYAPGTVDLFDLSAETHTLTLYGIAGQSADRFVVGTDGGDSVFEVSANNNVGIGTTSPYAKLSMTTGATAGDAFNVSTSTTGNLFKISNTATSTFYGSISVPSTGIAPIVGNATLGVGGTVVVNTAAATANSYILLTRKTSGGTIGTAITYTVTAGSFTISSDSVIDTSTFTWLLINP